MLKLILQSFWHLSLPETLSPVALELNSALICEDHIIKGFLVIYRLLAPSQSLQLVCFLNHLALPGGRIGPA